ncbi:MAG: hypothetical protein MI757_06925 [Pirellulales bacterium]|nr:hypothetical protein [Pirellulales bacterium]
MTVVDWMKSLRKVARSSTHWTTRSSTRRLNGVESLETRAVLSAVSVTTDADDGAGSFRDAVEQANADSSITAIVFDEGLGDIELETAVDYTGAQALRIDGNGGTIEASDANSNVYNLLESTGGADLTVEELTIQDSRGNGLYVDVPDTQTGTVKLILKSVDVDANDLQGVHFDDQTGDSAASLYFKIVDSAITDNGFGQDVTDFDGVRVAEGGAGNMTIVIQDADDCNIYVRRPT